MPDIELENVTKVFENGKVIAVSNVNLRIQDGSYVFILGPSGCGKTTLLRMVSGLLEPTTGKIYIDGKDVTHLPPQQRGIAFVFQNFEIFPMTVWENCVYALRVQGYPDDYIIEQGEKALKIVGLEDRADEVPVQWGNGDLQRLGIARAICSGAKILIMDEPLGSLDPKISAEFRWELRHIIKSQHLTAIQVTHNQEEAMALGDHIIIMRDGRLLQEDTPEHLYRYPSSLFVGNFLGGLNIIEGYIRHTEYRFYKVKARLGGPIFNVYSSQESFELDENVVLACRYEDIYLFPKDYDFSLKKDEWEGLNRFSATIIEKFMTGKERVYIIELDTGDTLQVSKPEVFQYDFEVNEEIIAGIFTENLRLFKYPANLVKEMALQ